MKTIRFYLDGEAVEFDTLKELRFHLWILNDKDKEELEGYDNGCKIADENHFEVKNI